MKIEHQKQLSHITSTPVSFTNGMEGASSSYQIVRREDSDITSAEPMPSFLPPGFRFSPTDEELCLYYLKRKIAGSPSINLAIMADIDLYKFDPEELPEKSVLKSGERIWYFFCRGDKKYQNGWRANRATMSGYWKITGRDRDVFSESRMVGKKKSLVFQRGRAPNGERTDWVMQEFSLTAEELSKCPASDRESYVVCKIFKKRGIGPPKGESFGAPFIEKDWIGDNLVEDTESNREKFIRGLNGDAALIMSSVYKQVLPLSICVKEAAVEEAVKLEVVEDPPELKGQANGIKRRASSLKHNGSFLRRKIHSMRRELAEKRSKLLLLESRNRALVIRESRLKHQLQQVRKELINGFQCFLNSGTEIGIKRFGVLNEKPFLKACDERFQPDSKALELVSLWKQNIKNPEWHPFKKFHLFGQPQEVIDDDDENLKALRYNWGEEVYEAVATALLEMNVRNAKGKHRVLDVWNFKNKRRATLKEVIRYIVKQMNRPVSKKRRR